MRPKSPSPKEILDRIAGTGLEYVRLETLDLSSIIRCRVLRPELLERVFEDGLNMSKAIFSFTVLEHLVPDARWGPADADFHMFPDTGSFAVVPYRERTGRMYAWPLDERGRA